ncbi:VacJ family lipoprotein [Campylobacter sp. faydin G-24]|uniref:VacJ family lipoprotein n=1 Tax=Campylobacter anatolicus TaxID=2829105 RepID=A0ABS5HG86_9BACT|nr:VacJ family lipoprotein [Campylobacter anatolicus]MBR8463281.1 VacJ family lipoprotein [Campylobacter anatolicus]
MKIFATLIFSFALLLATTDENVEQNDGFDVEFNSPAKVFDPLGGYNRVMTNINDFFYVNILTPTAKGYAYVVPKPARTAITNIFDNLMFPMRFINNLLQFKFKNVGDETLRFLANTIIGFAGVSDVATKYYGIPKHDEDFGQTLGYWGLGGGFHLVLPILGPSNLRDTIGKVGDYFTNPITYVDPNALSLGINAFHYLNDYSHDPYAYEHLKKDAIDLYPFLRDAYEQRRIYLIKD